MNRFIKRMIYGLTAIISVLTIIGIFIYLVYNFTAIVFAVLIMVTAFCIGLLIDKIKEE